ncbi:MAG: hypothetical protein WBD40_25460 [Tepidisphaeraceae bacterium]
MGEITRANSGKRLAMTILLLGVLAAAAGLFFREFTPRTGVPTTRPVYDVPVTPTTVPSP